MVSPFVPAIKTGKLALGRAGLYQAKAPKFKNLAISECAPVGG